MDCGLQLDINTDSDAVQDNDSWAVIGDGSLHHPATGITIGEKGLHTTGTTSFPIEADQIEMTYNNILGQGAGGVVVRGIHKPSQTPVAVKVVRIENKSKRAQLINDIHTLLTIPKSSFLIQFYAAFVRKDNFCVHVALEYMDYGSLTDVIKKVHIVPEHFLALIMVQILEGLKLLHLSYVVHRDVKLGNILVNSQGAVKLTDFGISKQMTEYQMADTFVGTATHMSLERVNGEAYSFPADIWSLGLCVYELASGKYPYGNVSSYPALFDVLANKPEPSLSVFEGRFSSAVCAFTSRCLHKNAAARATAIQLQADPFILENLRRVSQEDFIRWLGHYMRPSSG